MMNNSVEKYNDYTLWCVKLKDMRQIYFLSKDIEITYSIDSLKKLYVLYPMIGTPNEIGVIEFDYFVEYSIKEVLLNIEDYIAITKPVKPVEKLYMQSIRRIEFLQDKPENSKRVITEALKALKLKAEDKKVTPYDYRQEIMTQTDRLLDEANGIVTENKPKVVYNDENVVSIKPKTVH